MVKIVCLDYGHGGSDLGAVYKGNYESRHNLILGRAIAKNLRKYGVKVVETRQNDSFVSLEQRASLANRSEANLFVSLHRNAFIAGKATGVEAFVHKNSARATQRLAQNMLEALELIGFRNRGLKKASFYVLNKTTAPAILLEVGFLDNPWDNHIFQENLANIASSISRVIVENYK